MGDDSQIARRVLDGDVESFRILVERHRGCVCRLIRNMIGNRHDCEEIAQETFLAAYRGLAGFRGGRASFRTWLLTIARNRCIDAIKRRKTGLLDGSAEPTERRRPEHGLTESELFAALDEALAELPLEQRSAFILAELMGLPRREAARIEGVGQVAFRVRLSRARRALRSRLERFNGGAL